MYFMSNLDSKGKPIKENHKIAYCQVCGFTSSTVHGLRVHMAIHRLGEPTSYHTKDGLYKSGRHTYKT